jgi:hypothetical protein
MAPACANVFKLVPSSPNLPYESTWKIKFGDSVCHLDDGLVGLKYLHAILGCDSPPVFVWTTGNKTVQKEVRIWAGGSPVDATAPEELLRASMAAQLRSAIAQWNVEAKAAASSGLRNRYDDLMLQVLRAEEYLRESTALGWRSRTFADERSREKAAVGMALNRARAAIRKYSPSIADHFEATIVGSADGWFYSEPDIQWDTEPELIDSRPNEPQWTFAPIQEDPEVSEMRKAWLAGKIRQPESQAKILAAIQTFRAEKDGYSDEFRGKTGGWKTSAPCIHLTEATDKLEHKIEQLLQTKIPAVIEKPPERQDEYLWRDACWWDV